MRKKRRKNQHIIFSPSKNTEVATAEIVKLHLCPRCGYPMESWQESEFWGETFTFSYCHHCGVEIGE